MTAARAEAVLGWRYPAPYDFYNMTATADTMAELMGGDYAALLDGEAVAAFFCLGRAAQVPGGRYPAPAVDLGLGLRPDLTGRGLGTAFCRDLLPAAASMRPDEAMVRLTVAAFNQRALHLYQKLGFQEESGFEFSGHRWIILQRSLRNAGTG